MSGLHKEQVYSLLSYLDSWFEVFFEPGFYYVAQTGLEIVPQFPNVGIMGMHHPVQINVFFFFSTRSRNHRRLSKPAMTNDPCLEKIV